LQLPQQEQVLQSVQQLHELPHPPQHAPPPVEDQPPPTAPPLPPLSTSPPPQPLTQPPSLMDIWQSLTRHAPPPRPGTAPSSVGGGAAGDRAIDHAIGSTPGAASPTRFPWIPATASPQFQRPSAVLSLPPAAPLLEAQLLASQVQTAEVQMELAAAQLEVARARQQVFQLQAELREARGVSEALRGRSGCE
jgi:hypothetical protein